MRALLLALVALAPAATAAELYVFERQESCAGRWDEEGERCEALDHFVGADADVARASVGSRSESWLRDTSERSERSQVRGYGAEAESAPTGRVRVDASRCWSGSDVDFLHSDGVILRHAGSEGCDVGAYASSNAADRDVTIVRCQTDYAAEARGSASSGYSYSWSATRGSFASAGPYSFDERRTESCFYGVETDEVAVGYRTETIEECDTGGCITYPGEEGPVLP